MSTWLKTLGKEGISPDTLLEWEEQAERENSSGKNKWIVGNSLKRHVVNSDWAATVSVQETYKLAELAKTLWIEHKGRQLVEERAKVPVSDEKVETIQKKQVLQCKAREGERASGVGVSVTPPEAANLKTRRKLPAFMINKTQSSMSAFLVPKTKEREAKAEVRLEEVKNTIQMNQVAVAVPKTLEALRKSTMSKREIVMAVADDPALYAQAVKQLEADFYAPNTWASHASEVKLYENVCKRCRLEPYPVTITTMKHFSALLKAAQYKAAGQYFTAILREHNLRMHPALDQMTLDYKRKLLLSCKRDIGDEHRMEPIDVVMLMKMSKGVNSVRMQFIWHLACVEWFFLLRSAEALALAPVHCQFVEKGPYGRPRVSILVTKSKTDVQARSVKRILDCCCTGEKGYRMCAYHSLLYLTKNTGGLACESFTPGAGIPALEVQGYRDGIRSLLTCAGVEVRDEEGRWRFGTHSLRRGGAQALARAGWPLELIKFFGRWLSDVIEIYLLDAPMQAMGHMIASTMVTGITGGCDLDRNMECGPKRLRPGTGIRVFGEDLVSLESLHGIFGDFSGWISLVVVALNECPLPACAIAVHKDIPPSPQFWPRSSSIIIAGMDDFSDYNDIETRAIMLDLSTVRWQSEWVFVKQ